MEGYLPYGNWGTAKNRCLILICDIFPYKASGLFNPLVKWRHWPDTSCIFRFHDWVHKASYIINTDIVKIQRSDDGFSLRHCNIQDLSMLWKKKNFLHSHHLHSAWTSLWNSQRLTFGAIAQSVRYISKFFFKPRWRWLEPLSFILLPGLQHYK